MAAAARLEESQVHQEIARIEQRSRERNSKAGRKRFERTRP
jgi:hypothetical protein